MQYQIKKLKPMKAQNLSISAAILLFAALPTLDAGISDTNTFDGVIGYPGSGQVDTEAGSSDVSAFATTITNAIDNDLGATLTFGTSAFSPTTIGIIDVNFGTSLNRSVTVTASEEIQTVSSGGSFDPITGRGITTVSDWSSYTLSFSGVEDAGGSIANSGLVELGFTVLSRSDPDFPLDVEALVTFDDSSTTSLSSTISGSKGGDNTFFQFEAPSGRLIDSVSLSAFQTGTSTPVSTRIGVDDIGFVTSIPEPSTYSLLGGFLALGAVLLRRRS